MPDERALRHADVIGSARGLAAAYTERRGEVEAFDDEQGTGVVRDGVTGERWSFHCTRIADGSRTVAVGPATFRIEPGPVGLEAVEVKPA